MADEAEAEAGQEQGQVATDAAGALEGGERTVGHAEGDAEEDPAEEATGNGA